MVVQPDNFLVSKTMYATRRRKRNARKSVVQAASIKQSPTSIVGLRTGGGAGAVMAPIGTVNSNNMQQLGGDLIPPNGGGGGAGGVRSNPSKRHRERLNIELESLAELLPFDPAIVQKLDKLSILRLASSYLKAKCYLRSAAESCPDLSEQLPYFYMIDDPIPTLDGFLLVVTTDGELFFASSNVEMYLGFHQSDILHQSVLELIHSEDREMFKEQLEWNHRSARHEALSTPRRTPTPGSDFYLQRSFTARFRCLLDNTSGFVTMDVTGRLQPFPPGFPNSLTGGNNLAAASAGIRTRPSPSSSSNNSANSHANSSSVSPPNNGATSSGTASTAPSATPSYPSLALFAYCQPFGPGAFPVAAGQIDLSKTFKSKHSLDLTFISVDPRVRQVIEGADEYDFSQKTFYNIVHLPDLQYVQTAHAELMKRGNCGILAYRIVNPNTSTGGLVWLQTSARITYRCNKPETILCIHRRLTDDEGEGLIAKRASEFRLPCALFDAVEAASATSQQKAAAIANQQPTVLAPDHVTAAISQQIPSAQFQDAILDQATCSDSNSRPVQFGDGPGPAKRAKTGTGKRVTKKQQKQQTEQSALLATDQSAVGAVLLPHQTAGLVPRIEGIWPVSTPCYNQSNNNNNSLANYSAYYATSTMAEQFGSQQQNNGIGVIQQTFQTQGQNNQQSAYLPSADCLTSYYNNYGYGAGLVASSNSYDEFNSHSNNNTPCLYGNASGWNSRTAISGDNNFMANSEKLLSHYGYRLMYDDISASNNNNNNTSVGPGGQDQESPAHSSIGTTSDESPQTTSVIRHTTSFNNQAMTLVGGYPGHPGYSPGYSTPLPASTVMAANSLLGANNNNHPTMFQAQPLYAATPAPQFLS